MSQWVDRADYVARFKQLAGSIGTASLPPLASPPDDLTSLLLTKYSLSWDDLPPLAQRALLWDAGYIAAKVGSTDTYVQVQLPCTSSSRFMADIAASAASFPVGATTTCPSSVGTYSRSNDALKLDAKTTLPAKCALYTKGLALATSDASYYSQDALAPDVVPAPRLLVHATAGGSVVVPAIHTLPSDLGSEPAAAECPTGPAAGGMIIPCHSLALAKDPTFCLPLTSNLMEKWLVDIQATASKNATRTMAPLTTPSPMSRPPETTEADVALSTTLGPPPRPPSDMTAPSASNTAPSRTTLYLGIGGGSAVALVLLVALAFVWRRRRNQHQLKRAFVATQFPSATTPATTIAPVFPSDNNSDIPHHPFHYKKDKIHTDYDLVLSPQRKSRLAPPRTGPTYAPSPTYSIGSVQPLDDDDDVDVIMTTNGDPLRPLAPLAHVKVPLEALSWEVLLAETPTTETYYGQYHQLHAVALKLVRVEHGQHPDVIAAAVQEIVWLSKLDHPGIVSFLGFALDDVTQSPSSLVAVTEYCPQGTLPTFLATNAQLHWTLKGALALSIASAVHYLHTRGIVHGNLTSDSIWMDWPVAKLQPLAISALATDELPDVDRHPATTAPEVLQHGSVAYTAAADIYALGCILRDLDTQSPADDRRRSATRRSSVSRDCPQDIALLIDHCLETEAEHRPTSLEVVEALEAYVHGKDFSCLL
ncbi:Aste57867_16113 [Aphanomyces stellatus]|uniref:Aste57867_16113 protein n=1 Tax=Aphanomyces stellatus TaxID=120398 RepID=A0A485L505_9STRA|nr:hypothetical protein As57867_016057 [Aphanomyces stellatus]VFT92896.1 Aste57867_16113 [Aphanomyces stellatus]